MSSMIFRSWVPCNQCLLEKIRCKTQLEKDKDDRLQHQGSVIRGLMYHVDPNIYQS